MILGTGCDLVEIERMKKACEKEAFLSRVYTERERRQAGGKASVLAGDFAVKEAVAKVFGTGFRDFMPGDIETAEEKGILRLEVSISNTREYAMAFAVGEGE